MQHGGKQIDKPSAITHGDPTSLSIPPGLNAAEKREPRDLISVVSGKVFKIRTAQRCAEMTFAEFCESVRVCFPFFLEHGNSTHVLDLGQRFNCRLVFYM